MITTIRGSTATILNAVPLVATLLSGVVGCEPAGEPGTVDGEDITGVVMGPNGRKAGVWVIAERWDCRPGSRGSWSRTTPDGM
jgi:hypothetical protein